MKKRIDKIEKELSDDKILYKVFTPCYRINFTIGGSLNDPYNTPVMNNTGLLNGLFDNVELYQAFSLGSKNVIPTMNPLVDSGTGPIPLTVSTLKQFIGKLHVKIKLNWGWSEQWSNAGFRFINSHLTDKIPIKIYFIMTNTDILADVQNQCIILPLAGQCTYDRQIERLNQTVTASGQTYNKYKSQARVLWSQDFTLTPQTNTVYKQTITTGTTGVTTPTYRYRQINLEINRQLQLNKVIKYMASYGPVANEIADNFHIYCAIKWQNNIHYNIINRITNPVLDRPAVTVNTMITANIVTMT